MAVSNAPRVPEGASLTPLPARLEALSQQVENSKVGKTLDQISRWIMGGFNSFIGSFTGLLDQIGNWLPDWFKDDPKAARDQLQADIESSPTVQGMLSHLEIESLPATSDPKTGITFCSYTDRQNFASRCGIRVPQGDAIDVAHWYLSHPRYSSRILRGDSAALSDQLKRSGYVFADLFVKSDSQFGHRAMAFRSSADGEWYILDPYRGRKDPATGDIVKNCDPIPFALYAGEIDFLVPIDASISREADSMLDAKSLFAEIQKQDPRAAGYSRVIYSHTHDGLGTPYQSQITYRQYQGAPRTVKNHCVGFTMSGFEGLPIRSYATDHNAGRLATDYLWGTPKLADAKDGYQHFIPDLAGGNPDRYKTYVNLAPQQIIEEITPYLAEGEYAVAATMNHVFWIYKNHEGKLMMIHSGADVNGQYPGDESVVNELPLHDYLAKRHAQGTPFACISVRDLLKVAEEHGDSATVNYFNPPANV